MDTTVERDGPAGGGDRGGLSAGPHLSYTFTVAQTPDQAFAAINDVRGWWSQNIEGPTDELEGEFVYDNSPVHVARFRVTELVPGRRVTWLVLENFFSFIDDQREWVGNEIVFDIARSGETTQVTFTQIGLVPDEACYAICANAWGGYIKASLRSLIATGKGAPVPKVS